MPPERVEGGHRAAAGSASPGLSTAARTQPGLSELLAQVARPEPDEPDEDAWQSGAFPGQVVGRFELLRELGRGGFGVVFEARDRELGRLVAFKAVRPGTRASSAQRVEWLRREAEATAQLNHENIVALYDAGRTERGPYLVFELLEGETLAERLERGPLEPREAIRIAAAVARALAYAHAAGVLHRDLKPSNVFLTARGQVKVLDFGLAHVFGWTGARGGTPAYMAPEQWRGEAEDGRTDLFALGVMLYEMVTGRAPFAVRDGRSEVVDPGARDPALDGIPPPLRPVLASALAPAPDRRPRGAEALLERLIEADQALAASPRVPSRRAMGIAAIAATTAVLVASGAWWLWRTSRRADAEAAEAAAARRDTAAPESVDAYRHYFDAVEALRAGRDADALAELEHALELDPEFALAHYLRAYLAEFLGDPPAVQRASAEAAARYASRLPEKERLLVQAWAAHARGDDAGARRIYREAVDRFPDDAEVLYFAGDLLFHAEDVERSLPLFARALEARPGWGAPLEHLLDGLEVLGRHADMVAAARRAVAAAPAPETYRELGRALLPDDPDQAIAALRGAVLAGGGPLAIGQLSDGLMIAGRLDDAEAEARALLAPEVPPRWQLEGYHRLLKVRALQGRRREVLRLLDQIPAPLRAVDVPHAHEIATWTLAFAGADPGRLWLEARSWGSTTAAIPLAYAGDLPHAAELARGLSASTPTRRKIVDCLLLWRRGDRAGAARRLEETLASHQVDAKLPWFFLAAVRGELRRDRDALEAVRRFQRTASIEIPHAFSLPRARLIAARSLERLGERDEALREVDRLLALWKNADPDLPELAEARALRARLVGPRDHRGGPGAVAGDHAAGGG